MSAKKTTKSIKATIEEKPTFFSSFSLRKYIPEKFHIPIFVLVILALFLFFSSPLYFGGKTFQSGDIITSNSSKTYVENHTGEYTLWNPYVFGGMPAYALAVGYKWFNLIYVTVNSFRDIFSSPFVVDYAMWTFYLLALAYTMFTFFYLQTKNKLTSLLVALAVSFSTGLIVFLFIGHVTKLTSLWVFPVLFLQERAGREKHPPSARATLAGNRNRFGRGFRRKIGHRPESLPQALTHVNDLRASSTRSRY